MAMLRNKVELPALGTIVSFIVGVVGVYGELKKPTKDIPALCFFVGLMGVPVMLPGTKREK